jgi:hypothetical protein
LQNLKDLNLSFTNNVLELPEEIGNLTSLNTLNLQGSRIRSLPPSIGRLQNLKYLNLLGTPHIHSLPNEIWNLRNLTVLALTCPITILPSSIQRVTGLMYLSIHGAFSLICQHYGPYFEYLWVLVKRCRLVGFIHAETNHLTVKEKRKLDFALASNRARSRTGFLTMSPKLWPRLLNIASYAFAEYQDPNIDIAGVRIDHQFCPFPSQYLRIQEPDAIYQFLVDGRKLFIDLLVDRSTKAVPTWTNGFESHNLGRRVVTNSGPVYN